MFKASLRVLSTRKELALFPVLSGIATLIVAAGFAVPALLAYVDSDTRYVWVNEGYRRWFGRPPEAFP